MAALLLGGLALAQEGDPEPGDSEPINSEPGEPAPATPDPPATDEDVATWAGDKCSASSVPTDISADDARALIIECGGCQNVPLWAALAVGYECQEDCTGTDNRPRLKDPLPSVCPGP